MIGRFSLEKNVWEFGFWNGSQFFVILTVKEIL